MSDALQLNLLIYKLTKDSNEIIFELTEFFPNAT